MLSLINIIVFCGKNQIIKLFKRSRKYRMDEIHNNKYMIGKIKHLEFRTL